MNIEAYDLESLRKIVRTLQTENNELKELLRIANIPFSESNCFEDKFEEKESFDEDQGERIISPKNITDDMAKGINWNWIIRQEIGRVFKCIKQEIKVDMEK